MTCVLVSGATGYVGRFIVEKCLADGLKVKAMGRSAIAAGTFSAPVEQVFGDLDPAHDKTAGFEGVDVFVHAAFSHVPGKYRGGEGDEPAKFRRMNVDGSLALFESAKRAGVARAVFVSSRAVYGAQAPGELLKEEMPALPDTLYGEVKYEVECTLAGWASAAFIPVSLRATGIYGASVCGGWHKWQELFAGFRNGELIAPRVATEVHGSDLADAVIRVSTAGAEDLLQHGAAPIFNVSDIVLDRHDLLATYGERQGINRVLPIKANPSVLGVMDCSRLRALGWEPRGALDLTGLG